MLESIKRKNEIKVDLKLHGLTSYCQPLNLQAMTTLLANLFVEASVVGIVCIIFLILFVVAGVKQILSDRD